LGFTLFLLEVKRGQFQKKVAHEQKDKKCLRNTKILNYFPSFGNSSIFVVKYQSFTKFPSDGLSQDKSCEEIINQ